jgi:beta-phosphoglucomutase-like phosphatase (HAD superfamily)
VGATPVPAPALDLDELGVRWRSTFRAASDALADARSILSPAERTAQARRLREELQPTQELLAALAREHHSHRFLPLVVSTIDARLLLGLPRDVEACVFNLDGVLIGSAALHAAAWSRTFDEFLLSRSERTRGRFPLFNPRVDYPMHLHGRPRLQGVRAFLESRGIRLAEGSAGDAPGAETVHGLANRKNEVLVRLLDERGISAFEGSRSYLSLAHEAGIRCAVVSASEHTETILERSGLAELVDERIDGTTIAREHLRVKPEPDTLLAACEHLAIQPVHAVAFETTRAGVSAGRLAGFELVVGVDGALGSDPGAALRSEGAEVVVHDVGDFLERKLAA